MNVFLGLSEEQLAAVNLSSLSDEEKSHLIIAKRIKKLEKEQLALSSQISTALLTELPVVLSSDITFYNDNHDWIKYQGENYFFRPDPSDKEYPPSLVVKFPDQLRAYAWAEPLPLE